MKKIIRKLFTEIVLLLNQAGQLSIKDIYTDGTKLEANANKYTFVWGKAINTRKEKMLKRLNELWDYAESVSRQEIMEVRPKTTEELSPERIKSIIDELNNSLKDQDIDLKKKLK